MELCEKGHPGIAYDVVSECPLCQANLRIKTLEGRLLTAEIAADAAEDVRGER